MLVTPALPWPSGDGGGIIKLSRRISEDDLLAGAVKFTFDNAGRESVGSVVRNQNNQLIIRVDNDIFIVSPFPYGTDTLTLTRAAGEAAQAYSLIKVELNKLEPGIYGFSAGNMYCVLLKEDGVVYPIYKKHANPNLAYWWLYEDGVVFTDESNYPCNPDSVPPYREELAKYGITEVDLNGENVENLTVDEVTVL